MTSAKSTRRSCQRSIRAEIDRQTLLLQAALRRLHGGQWVTSIDHKARFILIRERLPRTRHQKEAA
jgi:hypothetical protein